MNNQKSRQTRLLHSNYRLPSEFSGLTVPTYRASTVLFKSAKAMRARDWLSKEAYTYGLHGTPTTFKLESLLSEIENAKHCILAPSGLAAIALVNFAFLRAGDDVLIPENIYGPNREMGDWLQEDFGITSRFYSPTIGAGIAGLIKPNTRLIWTEAPGSVTMEVPDIPAITKVAREKGVIVVLDNTWSAGLAFDGFAHGVDVVLQALTKYQAGSSDLLMGAVLAQSDEMYSRLSLAHKRLGFGVGADDVYFILRNLPSLRLRFDKHGQSALEVAAWLKGRPEIGHVLHPAFEDCPGHDIFRRDFTGSGGLFSVLFDAKYSEEQVDRFVEALELFGIGFSWGGAHSLCVPFRVTGTREDWKYMGNQLVRFFIGLEEAADLIADIEQALSALDWQSSSP